MSRSTAGIHSTKWAGNAAGPRTGNGRGSRRRMRPALLELEERRLLTTFNVFNANDTGQGSLRAAIQAANAVKGANTIEFVSFNQPATINLTTGQLLITDNGLTINGPNAPLTISGNGLSRVFEINTSTRRRSMG